MDHAPGPMNRKLQEVVAGLLVVLAPQEARDADRPALAIVIAIIVGAAAAAGRAGDGARGGGDVKSDVSINNININAPNATDAEGISKEIGPAIKRSSIAAPANYGLV